MAARAPTAFLILICCAGLATFFEVVRFPERTPWMLGADGFFASVIGICAWLIRWRPRAAPAVMVVATNLVGVVLNAYHAIVGAPVAPCVWTLTALVATTAVILPWGWRYHLLACIGAVVAYPLMLLPGDPLGWSAGATYLGCVVTLSVSAAGLIDAQLRADFELTARLAEREARLQSYFDLTLVGTAIVSPRGEWLEVNDEFCRILACKRDHLQRLFWPELVHADDQNAERVLFDHALGGREARASGDLNLIRADGQLVRAMVAMRGLPSRNNGVDRVMVLVQDITERSRAEAALRRAKEAAEHSQQNQRTFLALVSHELRNPMTIISGMTDAVLDGDLAPNQRRCLERARDATGTLVTLVNDVLDISRIDEGKLALRPRHMELRPWLDLTLEPLDWLAERRGLRFNWTVGDDVPVHMIGEPDRLRQILVNLVDNAVKFTQRGEVRVAVVRESADMLRFTVSDTGPGIPQADRERVFDAFAQLDVPTFFPMKGTGLGLAICRRLVELMGGRIWVESAPGEGSRFHVTVPIELGGPSEQIAVRAS